ncbi:MAG: SGNH/GDSL hydrolase family protein [Tannerellaceae bacterium]|jgi:lysophospholipase L1-like esterase|nr:SGNH/GDSL hydrolase family protein [Tannerellaceae bacterium]
MKKNICVCVCLLLGISGIKAQSIPVFKDGDRVAFVGNSITCGGHYHSYIWLYYMTRFPNLRIEIFNEGIGGDDARLMSKRLDKVFEHKPTVLALTFGMNDTGYMDFTLPENQTTGDKNVITACNAYQDIEKVYKQHSEVSKILIGGSPYDETTRFNKVPFPGKNKYMQDISDFLEKRAEANRWGYVDFNRPMVKINQREQQKDSTYTLCGTDRVHPTTDGHMVMACLFLKAQGLTGKPVADIRIDAMTNKVNRSENCQINDLVVTNDSIRFTYLANSLPYPIDCSPYNGEKKTQADALKVIPFMDEMNWEGLTVDGLPDGYWLLKIDGKIIARLNARELQRGINMAVYGNTPQNEQAQKIRFMNEQRWFIEREIREYYWIEYNLMRDKGMLWADNDAAVDTLRKYRKIDPFVNMLKDYWLRYMNKGIRTDGEQEQQNLQERIYQENKPQTLKVVLVRVH